TAAERRQRGRSGHQEVSFRPLTTGRDPQLAHPTVKVIGGGRTAHAPNRTARVSTDLSISFSSRSSQGAAQRPLIANRRQPGFGDRGGDRCSGATALP